DGRYLRRPVRKGDERLKLKSAPPSTKFRILPGRYQRTALRVTAAANGRPLNGLFLLRIPLSPQLPIRLTFYVISAQSQMLQQNPAARLPAPTLR
ncbi:hypothetical protein, partial [Azospirillum soli]|uniref:hypothetical protein n=1 Tax=Azospirillum soli TaxID=1304799 RepID=UPI001AE26BB1